MAQIKEKYFVSTEFLPTTAEGAHRHALMKLKKSEKPLSPGARASLRARRESVHKSLLGIHSIFPRDFFALRAQHAADARAPGDDAFHFNFRFRV